MKKYVFPLLFTLLPLTGCSNIQSASWIKSLQMLAGGQVETINVLPEAIDENSMWSYFVGSYQDPNYSGYMKFSLEWDGKGAIKTLIWNPNTFSYHADYLTTLPDYSGLSPAQIDAIALNENGRRLLLGTALAIKNDTYKNDQWDFQFVSKDPLSAELIAHAIKAIEAHMPMANPTKSSYLPAPEQLAYTARESASFAAADVKIAQRAPTSDRVCYASGWGAGFVKILDSKQLETALAEGTIQSDEILVLDAIPRELPAVAGIIIASPSSPSSHPALLAQMLGIPYFFEKNATTRDLWKAYANSHEPIFLQARGGDNQDCQVLVRDSQSLDNAGLAKLLALKKPQPLQLNPYLNQEGVEPLTLDQLGMNDGPKVGAKAANVAELRKIIPENTITEGLALPLSAYSKFLDEAMAANGKPLRPQYQALISQLTRAGIPLSETIPLLTELRTLIEKAKVPSALSESILTGIQKTFPLATRIKLRSSSNMEDLPEFNGAGLYESKGACVGDDNLSAGSVGLCEAKPDEVMKAIKKVWSSLYSMKAWVARRTFAIDENNVGMGVLIQRSYQGERANGVAIAQYPEMAYFGEEGLPDIEVVSTGFPGEDDSVTNPPVGKIPETTRLQKESMEVTVASTEIPRGQKLLKDAGYRSLYQLIEKIYRHYESMRKPSDPRSYVLDLEWKLIEVDGQERVIIKQVRPVPSPAANTQGLGFGTMVIGEKKALLCPTIQEDPNALDKLALSFPLNITVDLHELAIGDAAEIVSPIRSLSSNSQTITLPPSASLASTPWAELWGTSNEFRDVTVSSKIVVRGMPYDLNWQVRQTRAKSQKNRLLDGVQSLWTLDFSLLQGSKRQNYVLTVGAESCDSDAYQGLPPGSYGASMPYAKNRKPPVDFTETFESIKEDGLGIAIKARTSFQGFDKTRFLSVDEVSIKGLLPRTLVIRDKSKAVYAPGHHNFQWSYAFALDAIVDLTKEEKSDLEARGIHSLLLDYPGEYFPPMEMGLIVDEPLADTPIENGPVEEAPINSPIDIVDEVPPVERTYKVYGVDAAGVRKELGELRMTQQTNPFLRQ